MYLFKHTLSKIIINRRGPVFHFLLQVLSEVEEQVELHELLSATQKLGMSRTRDKSDIECDITI